MISGLKRWMIVPMVAMCTASPWVSAQQAGNNYVTGMHVTVPKPAGFTEANIDSAIVLNSPTPAGDNFKENMRVNYIKVGAPVSTKQFLDAVVANLKQNNYPDLKVTSETDFYIMGRVGKRVVLEFKANGLNFKSAMYMVSLGQDVVQGFAAMSETSYAQYAPLFDDVMARTSMRTAKPTVAKYSKSVLLDGVLYDTAHQISMPLPVGFYQTPIKQGYLLNLQNIKPGTKDDKYLSVSYSYTDLPMNVSTMELAKSARQDLINQGYKAGKLEEVVLGSRKWVKSIMVLPNNPDVTIVQYFARQGGKVYYITTGCLENMMWQYMGELDGLVAATRLGVLPPGAGGIQKPQNPFGNGNNVDLPVNNNPVPAGDARNQDKNKSAGTIKNGVFVSDKHNFTIKVPKAWVYAEDSPNYPLKLINDPKHMGDFSKLESMNVVSEAIPNPMTLQQYVDANLQGILNAFPNFQTGQNTIVTINGEKWGRLSGTIQVQGTDLQLVQFYIMKNQVGYVISFGTTPDKQILQEGFFKGVVGSFKYTGK